MWTHTGAIDTYHPPALMDQRASIISLPQIPQRYKMRGQATHGANCSYYLINVWALKFRKRVAICLKVFWQYLKTARIWNLIFFQLKKMNTWQYINTLNVPNIYLNSKTRVVLSMLYIFGNFRVSKTLSVKKKSASILVGGKNILTRNVAINIFWFLANNLPIYKFVSNFISNASAFQKKSKYHSLKVPFSKN